MDSATKKPLDATNIEGPASSTEENCNGNGKQSKVFDAAEFLRLVFVPGCYHEIRAVNVQAWANSDKLQTQYGYFCDPDKAAREIARVEKLSPSAVYFTLNYVPAELAARCADKIKPADRGTSTADKNIVKRSWFLIDIDPQRVSKTSSTDNELHSALGQAEFIAIKLTTDYGWPEAIRTMSGNGAGLLYRVDEPNDTETETLFINCLKAVSDLFPRKGLSVDQTVYNASQLSKVCGTWVRKGSDFQPDHLPECEHRPHRQSYFIRPESDLRLVTREQLEQLAALRKPDAKPEAKTESKTSSNGSFNLDDWLRDHSVPVGSPEPYAGGRKWLFDELPPPCKSHDGGHGCDGAQWLIERPDGVIQAGCHHNGCQWWKWQDLRLAYEPTAYDDKHSPENIEHGGKVADGLKAEFEQQEQAKQSTEQAQQSQQADKKPEQAADRFEKIRQAYFIEPGYSLRELLDADITDNYLIDNVLVERQSTLLAGVYKSFKTTTAANMALSLASGLSFLGRFRVNQRKRVLIASAESGQATLKKTIIGMAAALGDDFNRCDLDRLAADNMLRFEWWVPKSSNAEMLAYFVHLIDKHQADVVFLDPLYMSLDDQQASMILNGRQLAVLANEILRRGATPVFLDHVKRSSVNAKEYQPVELEDVSGAGKAEFFRQWLLIGRRQKFEAGQSNKLWLSIGGSAGHSSQWALDIDEENDKERRSYSITLQAKHEYDQGTREEKQSSQVDKRETREQAANERLQRKANDLVELVMKRDPTTGMTKTQIAERLRISNQDAGRVIGILLDDGRVKSVPNSVAISGKKYDGFYLSEFMPMGGEE